jgi:hypothetical protein
MGVLVQAATEVPTAVHGVPRFGVLIASGVAVVVGIGILIAATVVFLERSRRRDAAAAELQVRLADRLRRDPDLGGAAVVPTAHVPLGRRHIEIRVEGEVRSPQARRRVLDVINEEVARAGRPVHVADDLRVRG